MHLDFREAPHQAEEQGPAPAPGHRESRRSLGIHATTDGHQRPRTMKKTHLVYSTRKVASARRSVPSQPSAADAEVETTQGPPVSTRMASTGSTRSTGSSSGGGGGSESSSTTRHRSQHHHRSSSSRKYRVEERTVKRLRPSPALLQSDQVSVAHCVRSMVDKQTDATLLLDKNGLLTGILTDRDIAFKVVAAGKNPKLTRVSDVMTLNPSCVSPHASAIDALKKMVSGQFRHLPVADNEKVVGILDIAKCLYEAISKIEHAYDVSPERLSEAVRKLERHISEENLFEIIRRKLFQPTLSAILSEKTVVPVVSKSTTATDAAKLMKENKISAVIVCDDAGEMLGIVTTKDLMRRVVARGLDPSTVVVSDIMTKNPYSATTDTTILDTLHSMHEGKFLHVPVYDQDKKLVGLVDVLQVTCGVVQQMGTFQRARSEGGPSVWTRTGEPQLADCDDPEEIITGNDADADDEADAEDEHEHEVVTIQSTGSLSLSNHERQWDPIRQHTDDADASNPIAVDNPVSEVRPDVFVYKLADCYGSNHRFTSSAESVKELLRDVQNRLGDHTIRSVHYVDDEGDHVLLFTDEDLKDAVNRARMWGNKYIRLIVPHLASHRNTTRGIQAARHALASGHEINIGMVYYAAAAAAIAGASFFLSRRR